MIATNRLYVAGAATSYRLGIILSTFVDDNGVIYVLDTFNDARTTIYPTITGGSIRKLVPQGSSYNISNVFVWPNIGFVGFIPDSNGNLLALGVAYTTSIYTQVNPYTTAIYNIPLDGSMITSSNIYPITGGVNKGLYINTLMCDAATGNLFIPFQINPVNLSAQAALSATSITVVSEYSFIPETGMYVAGKGIPPNTRVTAYNLITRVVTLSAALSSTILTTDKLYFSVQPIPQIEGGSTPIFATNVLIKLTRQQGTNGSISYASSLLNINPPFRTITALDIDKNGILYVLDSTSGNITLIDSKATPSATGIVSFLTQISINLASSVNENASVSPNTDGVGGTMSLLENICLHPNGCIVVTDE